MEPLAMTITPKSMPLKSTALQRGLTLVELVAVLAIIGVLTSISVPMYSDYITRSKILAAYEILITQQKSLDNYFADNGTYLNASACGATIDQENYLRAISTADWKITCKTISNSIYELKATGTSPALKNSAGSNPVEIVINTTPGSGGRFFVHGDSIGWAGLQDSGIPFGGSSIGLRCWPTSKTQTSCSAS